MMKRTKPPPLQRTMFDDDFGQRVANFTTERGMRPLKPHEIETMNELGESVCKSVLPLLMSLMAMRGHIKTYLEESE